MPPAELESLLLTHPGVIDVGVVGVPDLMAGELPKAYVVIKPNMEVTAQHIQDYVASKDCLHTHIHTQKKHIHMFIYIYIYI